MKNKGFSLVELIIVIAIMAILAAAIAPALIRYIDKSRRSDDVAAAESVNTAAQAAFSNEEAYDDVQAVLGGSSTITIDGETIVLLASAAQDSATWTGQNGLANTSQFIKELSSNVGTKSPKLKYTKDGANGWAVGINKANNKPVVFLHFGTVSGVTQQEGKVTSNYLELQPSICAPYK